MWKRVEKKAGSIISVSKVLVYPGPGKCICLVRFQGVWEDSCWSLRGNYISHSPRSLGVACYHTGFASDTWESDFGLFCLTQTLFAKLDCAIFHSPHKLWKDSKISASVALTAFVFERSGDYWYLDKCATTSIRCAWEHDVESGQSWRGDVLWTIWWFLR